MKTTFGLLFLIAISFSLSGQQIETTSNSANDSPSATTINFNYTGSIQTWTVPPGITSYVIMAAGSCGGTAYNGSTFGYGGYGSTLQSTFSLTPGENIKIAVGGQGSQTGNTSTLGAGGGGGSFVWHENNTTEPMLAAGGGGGGMTSGSYGYSGVGATITTSGSAATSGGSGGSGGNGGAVSGSSYGGGGGAGWKSDGQNSPYAPGNDGGKSRLNGFAGGSGYYAYGYNGGFGGGAGATHGGGGGGGYSGGGGANNSSFGGGGGGSYNAGTNQNNTAANNAGLGFVTISYVLETSVASTGIPGTFEAYQSNPSTDQVIYVSGCLLSTDLQVQAPDGFEVRLSGGSEYTNLLSIAPVSNTVNVTPVYVRMKASTVGSQSGLLSISSTGATTRQITLTGVKYAFSSIQASLITISNRTQTTADLSWTNGNGSRRAVFVKATSSGSATPLNLTTYSANASLGSGTQIGGTGWYCVYNGTGSSVSLSGLTKNTNYGVMVTEYLSPDGSEDFNVNISTANPAYFKSLELLTYNVSGVIQTWTVPSGITSCRVTAAGSSGGTSYNGSVYGYGGYGSTLQGTFSLTPGENIKIAVGGQGALINLTSTLGAGGGGGSFVWHENNTTEPMLAAGGGGGGMTSGSYGYSGVGATITTSGSAATSGGSGGSGGNGGSVSGSSYGGGGGAGWKSDGQNSPYAPGNDGGKSRLNGFAGGSGYYAYGYNGGFGGGAGATHGGGGGGGYSGGGGANNSSFGGGGGGSYNAGTNQNNTAGNNSGLGYVTISYDPMISSISVSSSLSAFTSCSGTASTEQSFTTSGSDLSADISVTAPTGFELSTTSGGSYSSSLTLTQSNGTVVNTTIYVRMAASASGTPSGNITLASTGATTQNVAVSGSVYSEPVVNAGDDQTVSTASATLAGSISGSASTGTWSGGAGTFSPNNTSLTATYTPTAAERLAGTLTLTSADPEGPCGSVSDNVVLTFTSASKISISDGNWETADNWSPSGIPTLIDNVTINHTVTVNSSLAADPAICNNLAINSGKLLTVASGKALTVKGSLTNPAGATLTVVSGGSLITNGSISNNGTINIQRTITKDRWHLISSPVTEATAQVFEEDYLQSWSEVNAEWTDIISTGTALNPVQGYGLWTMYSSDHTYTFTGTPNTGNLDIELTVSNNFPDPGTGNDGANLLGNPYPSAIDWSMLDNTYGAVYYWQGNGTNGEGTYLSWNNGSGDGSQYIAPAQGFFVVAASAGTFSLTNAHRTHSVGSYYKSTSDTKDNVLVLETVSKGISNKLYVNFDTQASEGFDLQYDAYKFPSGTAGLSELYSYADDKKLSIDARPKCDEVQLGFSNDESGTYSIGINQLNGINKAILEDTKTNTFTDLLKGSYSFSWLAGEDDKRFNLHVGTVGIDDIPQKQANIYSSNKTVYVKLNDMQQSDIYIYNAAGQLVTSRLSATGLQSIQLSTAGVYVVKVVSESGIQTQKIIINQ